MQPHRLLPALILAAACGRGAAGPSSKPSAAPEQPLAQSASGPPAPAPTLRFEPRPGPVLRAEEKASSLPRFAFKKPSADEIVEPQALSSVLVEVDAELSRLGPRAGIEVSLDGLRPRRIADRGMALSLLVPADRELSAGEHHLIAAAADAEGRLIRTHAGRPLFASVRFWFKARGAAATPPAIVCFGPNGTYYGQSAEPAVDLLVLRPSEPKMAAVVATVSGAGAPVSARIDAAQPWGILGLMSGDYRVGVELAVSAPGARADCVFTLNRETERTAK